MTWETKDLLRLPMTPLYAGLMVVLLGSFAFFEGSPPPSLESRCEMKGGEWLHGSAAPTCVMGNGDWLVYNESADDYLIPGSADEIEANPQVNGVNVAHATSFATVCGGDFNDYPVEGIFGKRPAGPDFSTWQDATKYRTAISNDVARGANFAGHYTVASWGCPEFEGCQGHAVVDAINGKILAYGLTSSAGVEYEKESRLLKVKRDGVTEKHLLNEDTGVFAKCQ